MTVFECLDRKNNNLNLLRLALASLVIISHSYAIFFSSLNGDPLYSLIGVGMGSLAVKVFFFLSGILVCQSYLNGIGIIKWILARVARIIPAYALVIILCAIIIGPLITTIEIKEYFSTSATYKYIWSNIAFQSVFDLPGVAGSRVPGVNGSIWTIPYEVMCYAIFIFLTPALLKINKALALILFFSFIILPFTSYEDVIYSSYGNQSFYLLLPCFSLGCIVALLSKQLTRNKLLIAGVVFLVLFLFFLHTGLKKPMFYSFAFMTCLLSFYAFTSKVIINLRLENDISYGVYLWGFPLQQLTYTFISTQFYVGLPISLILSFSAGLLSWLFIEKPMIIKIKKTHFGRSDILRHRNNIS